MKIIQYYSFVSLILSGNITQRGNAQPDGAAFAGESLGARRRRPGGRGTGARGPRVPGEVEHRLEDALALALLRPDLPGPKTITNKQHVSKTKLMQVQMYGNGSRKIARI